MLYKIVFIFITRYFIYYIKFIKIIKMKAMPIEPEKYIILRVLSALPSYTFIISFFYILKLLL